MEKSQKRTKAYLGITQGAIHTLLLLFLLGMIANLYIEIPEGLLGHDAWSWVFSHSAVIAIHAILGILLMIVSLSSLALALLSRRTTWIVGSLLGLLFTLLAAFSGSAFVSEGGTNLSSFLMTLGFLGALVSYSTVVFQPKKN